MIRITTQNDGARSLVTIAGRIADSDIKEIRRVRNSLPGDVVLDLCGLDTCTGSGIQLLREWLDSGAQLQAATPFLEMVLKDSSAGGLSRGLGMANDK